MIKSILITGASSGLGAALAKSYAKEVDILYLSGRNKKRLENVVAQCKANCNNVESKVIDITNKKAMQTWFNSIFKDKELDMVIANAGISSGGMAKYEKRAQQIRELFATNVDGTLNTILPAISHFEKIRRGKIVIISSLSGLRGMPSAPAYSASKGAMKLLGEALRHALKPSGINLTVVTPGFIETPLTNKNKFKMPFLMSAEKAASIIQQKLKNNPARIAFPWPMYFAMCLLNVLPSSISDIIFNNLPKKN